MAVEVFARVAILGDDDAGFKGSGGGALSGSELSHLEELESDAVLVLATVENTYIGTTALP